MRPLGRGGLTVGPLAFGSAPIGNLGRVVADDEWPGAIDAALETGVRYFDTAPHYGLGLAETRGWHALPDDCIVSTKVGRVLEPSDGSGTDDEGYAVPTHHIRVRDYSRDGILRSLEASLDRLQRDRVDILFVHDPDDFYEAALNQAFPALEELRSQGVITSYGAGMNQSEMLAEFVRETDLDVIMLAGRYTLLEQGALDDLLPECERRNVSVVAAGRVQLRPARAPAPARGRHLQLRARAAGDPRARERASPTCSSATARRCPQAAAQFALAHPAVATVCLGARNRAQVERNAALFDKPGPGAGLGRARRRRPPPRRSPGAGMNLLEVKGVSKSFPGVKALEDMHLELRRRRGARAGRRERRRQVDADEAAERHLHRRRGRVRPQRRALRADLGQARARARHQHHPSGVQPDARPDGRAEPVHRARAGRLLHERAAPERAGAGADRAPAPAAEARSSSSATSRSPSSRWSRSARRSPSSRGC